MESCNHCVYNPDMKTCGYILDRLTVYSALLPQVLSLAIVVFFGGNMLFYLAYFAPTII